MDNYNLQQTDAKIQAILNKVQPVVDNNTVAGFGNGYAICATAGATADKEVTINGFTPTIGGVFSVLFQNAFSASDPTLNVSNTGAKELMLFGSALPAAFVPAGTILTLTYDGTNYNVIGRLNDITVKSTLESTDSPLLQDANGNFIKSTPAALASLLGVKFKEEQISSGQDILLKSSDGNSYVGWVASSALNLPKSGIQGYYMSMSGMRIIFEQVSGGYTMWINCYYGSGWGGWNSVIINQS